MKIIHKLIHITICLSLCLGFQKSFVHPPQALSPLSDWSPSDFKKKKAAQLNNGLFVSLSALSNTAKNMPALIEQLKTTVSQNPNPEQDALLNHGLHTTHEVRFYAIQTKNPKELIQQLHRNAFGKIGPLLATQEDGVVIPFIGNFFALEKAVETKDGRIELEVKELTDDEIELYFRTTGRGEVSLGEMALLSNKTKEECRIISDRFVE